MLLQLLRRLLRLLLLLLGLRHMLHMLLHLLHVLLHLLHVLLHLLMHMLQLLQPICENAATLFVRSLNPSCRLPSCPFMVSSRPVTAMANALLASPACCSSAISRFSLTSLMNHCLYNRVFAACPVSTQGTADDTVAFTAGVSWVAVGCTVDAFSGLRVV